MAIFEKLKRIGDKVDFRATQLTTKLKEQRNEFRRNHPLKTRPVPRQPTKKMIRREQKNMAKRVVQKRSQVRKLRVSDSFDSPYGDFKIV